MSKPFNPSEQRSPDLKIAYFQLWVHKRQFPDSYDHDDGNWLHASAYCSQGGGSVLVSGSILMITDIVQLADGCEALLESDAEVATLPCIEPELHIEIKKIDKIGHLEMTIQITPDYLTQKHLFMVEIDQSYLPEIIKQCRIIEDKYPVRDKK